MKYVDSQCYFNIYSLCLLCRIQFIVILVTIIKFDNGNEMKYNRKFDMEGRLVKKKLMLVQSDIK